MDNVARRNILFKFVEALVTIGASLVQISVITRFYTTDQVGTYQLVQAYLFFLIAFTAQAGIGMITSRDLSVCKPHDFHTIAWSAIVLQSAIALLLGLVALPIALFQSSLLSVPFLTGIVAVLAAAILQGFSSILIARNQIQAVVRTSICGHLIATGLLTLVASRGGTLTQLVLTASLAPVIQGAASVFLCRADISPRLLNLNLSVLSRIARGAVPIVVMVLATHLYVKIDTVLLSYYTDAGTVAKYSVGYLILDYLMVTSNFMMGALFPNFSRAVKNDRLEFYRLYNGILSLFIRYLFPVAAIIALFSRPILSALYGEQYADGALSLSLLMLAAVFAWINGPSGTIFVALGRQSTYMVATLLSLLVNLVGNIVLIPRLGAPGAALATVLTEFFLCLFCVYRIWRETSFIPLLSRVGSAHKG